MVRLAVVGQGAGAPAQMRLMCTANTASCAQQAPAAINAIAVPAPVAAPAANDPLTPLERIAVSVASETAATQQQIARAAVCQSQRGRHVEQSAAGAAAGGGAGAGAADDRSLPISAAAISQNAFQKSGLFLESSLATGSLPSDRQFPISRRR